VISPLLVSAGSAPVSVPVSDGSATPLMFSEDVAAIPLLMRAASLDGIRSEARLATLPTTLSLPAAGLDAPTLLLIPATAVGTLVAVEPVTAATQDETADDGLIAVPKSVPTALASSLEVAVGSAVATALDADLVNESTMDETVSDKLVSISVGLVERLVAVLVADNDREGLSAVLVSAEVELSVTASVVEGGTDVVISPVEVVCDVFVSEVSEMAVVVEVKSSVVVGVGSCVVCFVVLSSDVVLVVVLPSSSVRVVGLGV